MITTPRPSRRRFLQGAGMTAAGLFAPGLLSACGSGNGSTGGDSGTGTVELWIDIQGEPNQTYFSDKVIGAFEQYQSDIDVKVTYYTGADLRKLIQTALQAKSGPDLVRGPSATQTLAWSKADVLADLSSYADEWAWADTLVSWAMEAFTTDGKLFALPMRVDTLLMYTNQTLFAEKGWGAPTTLAELEGLAEEAHGQGITPFGASNTDWKAASEWHMSAMWNHYSGPEAVYQALTGEITWTEPVFVEAVELLRSWFDKGWFGGGAETYFSVPAQEVGANFGNGTVAMVPQGVWWMSSVGNFFGTAANNENEWDWSPWPALRDEVAYPLFDLGIGGSLGINAHSDSQDAAAEYLNWYYGDREAALQRMADVPATYNIPIQFDAAEVPAGIDERSRRVLDGLNTAVDAGNYGYVTWTWWPPKANAFVYEGFEKVLTGDLSPADYCEQMDQLFQEERTAGDVPQIISRA
ncbi:ABC transporter substrate-binding protein [Jiangella asiatica]|uniref:Extracellular solute-binding protein n=1 Tax=Jiangella asiatica TaxID=2530372 RepID=A0A4R5DJD9_9ACTN|nr:extracellular solute-binding protein [Jiangella asiatica]TDE10683.1 extracellular solute-binding protein [Jiangella asiatica]